MIFIGFNNVLQVITYKKEIIIISYLFTCKYTFPVSRVVFELVESSQKGVFELLYSFYRKYL